jgi:hypothetical protein
MNITDELERLSKLHAGGGLTDDEFAKAKAKLLDSETAKSSDDDGRPIEEVSRELGSNSLGNAANRYVTFQIVMGVIGIIVFVIVALAMISTTTSSHSHFP